MNPLKRIMLLSSVYILAACSAEESSTQKKLIAKSPDEVTETLSKTVVARSKDQADVEMVTATGEGFDTPLMFSLTDLDGKEVKASDYRGKWLVINYWATWCAPCRDEMPELVKFQKENMEQVQVVGIAFEDSTIDKLKAFAQDFNVNYPLLTIDVYNPPEFAAEGGMALPTTIVYNPKGMRHKKHIGPIDAEGLAEMIQ